jgi:4-methoxybenzoate monooxygenase (O-demethylating)
VPLSAPVVLDVDPFDERVLADPFSLHATIREAAPAVWIPKYEAWFVGRDVEVREVLTDWSRFSSAFGVGMTNIRRQGTWQKPSVILEVDPPDHAVTRRLLAKILSPKAIRQMRHDFERLAIRLVDELVERRSFDAVSDLAFRFPFTVLPDAVGLTHEGRDHLTTYSAMYFNNRVPGTALAVHSAEVARDAGSLEWVAAACSRSNMTADGFGAQIYEAVDAGEIDDATAGTLVRTFLGGGVDTTVLALGSMIQHLAGDPQQWSLLSTRPELVRTAFDETLRLTPPAPFVGRTTTAATELGGVPLDAEQKLFCMVGAANRDPRRWEDPDRFDLTRNPAGQLAFGLGPHFCVGAAVARLESEVLLATMLERIERLELTGDPEPELNNWLLGPRHLPVSVTPR